MVTLLAKVTANFNAFQIEIVLPFQSELETVIVTVKKALKKELNLHTLAQLS